MRDYAVYGVSRVIEAHTYVHHPTKVGVSPKLVKSHDIIMR